MPTTLTPPTPNPQPPGPTAPPSSPPNQPHHTPPRPTPRNVPTNAPSTQPQPQPLGPALLVGLALETVRQTCPTGKQIEAGKRRGPRNGNEEKKRRQRPCQGTGRPVVTYRPRRRRIGRFYITRSSMAVGVNGERLVKKKTEKAAKKAGYDPKRRGVQIESELDEPKTFLEKMNAAGPDKPCYYQVWAIEQRRICRCPDGSPCRRTTR